MGWYIFLGKCGLWVCIVFEGFFVIIFSVLDSFLDKW